MCSLAWQLRLVWDPSLMLAIRSLWTSISGTSLALRSKVSSMRLGVLGVSINGNLTVWPFWLSATPLIPHVLRCRCHPRKLPWTHSRRAATAGLHLNSILSWWRFASGDIGEKYVCFCFIYNYLSNTIKKELIMSSLGWADLIVVKMSDWQIGSTVSFWILY